MHREISDCTSILVTLLWFRAVVMRKTSNGSDTKTERCSIFNVNDNYVCKDVNNDCKSNEQRKECSSN